MIKANWKHELARKSFVLPSSRANGNRTTIILHFQTKTQHTHIRATTFRGDIKRFFALFLERTSHESIYYV